MIKTRFYKAIIDNRLFCRVIDTVCMFPPRPVFLALAISLSLPLVSHGGGPEEAFRQLMQPAGLAELNSAVAAARAAGLSRQTIVEARLLYAIRVEDTKLATDLLPELEQVALDFKSQRSPGGLRTVEQFRGLICYVKAMMAAEAQDEDEMRSQVAEGLWKYPQQASLFGNLVVKFQLNERMSHLTVDFAMPLTTSQGDPTTLSDLLGTQKALLLEFWSTQGEESVASLPGMLKRSGFFKTLGIAAAGVNIDAKDGDLMAEKVRQKHKISFPWLSETRERSVSRLLDVASLPRVVLISQQGRILYNGSPDEPGFGKALQRVVPSMPGLAK